MSIQAYMHLLIIHNFCIQKEIIRLYIYVRKSINQHAKDKFLRELQSN